MKPAGIQVIGEVTKPPMPQSAILYNVMLADKWRGSFPSAIAPFGHLSLSSASDSYVLASGTSPAMVVPAEAGALNKDLQVYADLYAELVNLMNWKDVESMAKDWLSIPSEEVGDRVISVVGTRTQNIIMKHHTYQHFLAHMQRGLMNVRTPGAVRLEAIGLGVVAEDGEKVHYPYANVRFGAHAMKMEVPSQPQTIRELRETFRYHGFLTYCFMQLVEAMGGNLWTNGNMTTYDAHAFCAYLTSAYGGFGKKAPDGITYTVDDVVNQVLPFAALPHSKAYPRVGFSGAQAHALAVKELVFKIALGLVTNRVAGVAAPVQYVWTAGAAAIVRDALPHYIKPTLKLGGGNTAWLHPAMIRDIVDGIYMPMAIRENGGKSVWERRSTWSETFKEIVVDRGEVIRPEEDSSSNLRLVVTRDGRIYTLRDRLDRYIVVESPLQEFETPAQHTASAYFMAYITDSIQGPDFACFVTPAAFHAHQAFVARGQFPIAPLPSGVVPIDGTRHLVGAGPAGTVSTQESLKDGAGKPIAENVNGQPVKK